MKCPFGTLSGRRVSFFPPLCVCVCARPPRFSWRYQLREFKSEFRVVAIDMRGYGESDLPLSAECYRFEHLVTDVKDIVEYLGEGTTPDDEGGLGGGPRAALQALQRCMPNCTRESLPLDAERRNGAAAAS